MVGHPAHLAAVSGSDVCAGSTLSVQPGWGTCDSSGVMAFEAGVLHARGGLLSSCLGVDVLMAD